MGTYHQYWLKIPREVVLTAVAISATATTATAQHSGDSLAFTSASVNATASALSGGSRGRIRLQRDGVFSAMGVTLRELIEYAYQRHPLDRREVTGGPAWIDSARFDIVATAAGEHWIDPDGAPRKTWAMLRTLLSERFRLQVEEDTRDRPVYLLVQASSPGQLGPRLQRSAVDCGALLRQQAQASGRSHGPACSIKTPSGRLFANTVSMPTLATLIASHLDRPVIDGTGLVGRFDVQLEAAEIKAPPGYTPGPSDLALPPAAGPSIFVAVREQLGLKLHAQVALISVLVIRRAERPGPD
jgi:uncharacterized protein (TIGR03435 family)